MLVEWNDDYLIGVPEIDDQHRQLFDRFQLLLGAIDAGQAKDELVPLLDYLDDYARRHFAEEEAVQRECHYPQCSPHADAHRRFIADVETLRGRIGDEGPSAAMVIDAGRKLFRWLVIHICGMDQAFGNYLSKVATVPNDAGDIDLDFD